jgi:hypothetical protein
MARAFALSGFESFWLSCENSIYGRAFSPVDGGLWAKLAGLEASHANNAKERGQSDRIPTAYS